MFFLFNAGQLTQEKTKLVNATDAVAYSAGIMHARALNFAALTNQALVANEVAVAQMVSLASWSQYLTQHRASAKTQGCDTAVNNPTTDVLVQYTAVCKYLADPANATALDDLATTIAAVIPPTMAATEAAKVTLHDAQTAMLASLKGARNSVMQQVAEANYVNDGSIEVDLLPLQDTFFNFGGKLNQPVIRMYAGADRTRMAEVVMASAQADGFTAKREWTDSAVSPDCATAKNTVKRTGGITLLPTYDKWAATDTAIYNRWSDCATATPLTLGTGAQTTDTWGYSGIPSFLELSPDALAAPDARVQFAVRVLRHASQTRTSDGRSDIKPKPDPKDPLAVIPATRINNYKGKPGAGVYVGLAASEVFYAPPYARADGKTELASLFNPYWQVHLIPVADDVRKAAYALQGVEPP